MRIAIAFIFSLLIAAACSSVSVEDLSCNSDTLTEQIVKLSEDNQNPFSPRILSIRNTEQISRTRDELKCEAKALLSISDGPNDLYTVEYHAFETGEGTLIGYDVTDLFK